MIQDLVGFKDPLLQIICSKTAIFTLLIIFILNILRKRVKAYTISSQLKIKAKNKRKQRDTQIALEFTPPTEISEDIRRIVLDSNVTQLLELLNSNKITSEQILRVYHSRAITLGVSLELIAESNYQEALALARKCDEIRKNTPSEERHKLGNLFGIPISIKDSFIQLGMDSTCGEARRCFNPCPNDGEIIAVLKLRGAIPFIRSNVPQTLGILDCVNNIWGRGLNPWNKDRSIGGSSGGEAGLIAAKCSPIGLGSDALGSVRIPAAFCGICAFKPTKGRHIIKGHSVVGPYAQSKFSYFFPNNGPLARCVDDLVLFTKDLICDEGRIHDPIAPLVPWNDNKYNIQGKLRIGYVLSEDFFGAAQPCQRAVREAIKVLESKGHEAVEIKIPNFEKMLLLLISITSSEGGGKGLLRILGGEKPVKELQASVNLRTIPKLVKKLVKYLLKYQGHQRLYNLVQATEEVNMEKFHEKASDFINLRDEFLEFWSKKKLDAIVAPAMALPTFKHGHGVDLALASCYNWPANIANLAAGVLPVTTVQSGEDIYTNKESIHSDRIFRLCQESINGSVGLPVGVQVMCLPWEDEKCLGIMKLIENQVNFQGLPNI